MAKKGERVGAMGDSVYYRTPDGQIIDDSGNVLKGPMAKMLADEYESKQQEKAKAQAEAKAAADEAKRQAAAAKSAEIARKAAEKEALQKQRQEQAEARKAEQEARRQEAQAASDARRQQAEANRQRTANVKQSAPKAQQAPAADAPQSMGDKVKGAFKQAAMNAGATAFNAAFPSFAIKPQGNAAAGGGGGSASDATDGSVRQAVNRVADEVNTTNMMMQTSIARQEMTNQLLGSILKEVQQIKKPSLIDAAADALSGLGGGKGKASSKVAPKSGMLGAAGSVLRRAPVIGALLGGGLSGYDEYQESGNAGRAVSTGAGAAAGGGLGAWGGATAGAALGAFGGPVGMAIGGLLGAVGGGLGGSWLGSKAGKGAYDMLAPGPGASADIKEAQATKLENKDIKNPTDSIVNVKTLTFNAENLVFNSKNQQGVQPNQPPVTNENKTNTNTTGNTSAGATQVSNVSLPSPLGAGASNSSGAGAPSSAGNATRSDSSNAGGGDQIEQILTTIRKRESGGNYQAKAKGSSASGAYQFIDSTWQSLTKKFGIGSQFKSAGLAPKETQDAVARKYVQNILQENNGDVSKVPLVWYTGNAQGKMSANALAVNGGLTPQTYQSKWMNDFGAAGNMQADSSRTQTPGGGTNTIEAARQQASASGSQSFGVTPGQAAPARVQPNQQVAALGNNGPSAGGPPNATAVQLAETMVGKNRNQSLDFLRAGGYNNQGEAWCAQFVNSSLKQSGASGSGSAIANSFQNYGSGVDPTQVQPGDVVLQTRGKGAGQTGGHVGIATGVYRNGQIEMIAGNTSGAVRKYMVPVNSQLMVRRGGGTQLAGGDKNKADPTVGGTPGALTPSTGATSAQLSPKESQTLQTAALQPAGSSKGAELGQASTKDMADQRSAKQGITVNQNTMSTPASDSTKGKYSSGDVGIVEPVDARLRLKELFGMSSFA